jgi:hypothetical protein
MEDIYYAVVSKKINRVVAGPYRNIGPAKAWFTTRIKEYADQARRGYNYNGTLEQYEAELMDGYYVAVLVPALTLSSHEMLNTKNTKQVRELLKAAIQMWA